MVVCILTRKNSMTVIMLSSAPTTSNHALVVLLSLLLPSASTIATITTNMRSTFRTHCAIIVRSLVVHKHAGVVFYGFDGGAFRMVGFAPRGSSRRDRAGSLCGVWHGAWGSLGHCLGINQGDLLGGFHVGVVHGVCLWELGEVAWGFSLRGPLRGSSGGGPHGGLSRGCPLRCAR